MFPCFLLEPTPATRRWLRRYTSSNGAWTCPEGWHQARSPIEDGLANRGEDGAWRDTESVEGYLGDSRWPTHCAEGCGYAFSEEDARQLFTRLVWRVTAVVPGAALAVGDLTTLEDAPHGAMWYADWMGEWAHGPDDRCLVVKVPERHDWMVDGKATNCTRKGDRSHRCWIRAGTPPFVTAGKDGETCDAGAGSIQTSDWHGFLRDGVLA